MTDDEKWETLEELFDVERGGLTSETKLETLGWDSLRMLSCLMMFRSRLAVRLDGDEIQTFTVVGDLLAAMDRS